MEMIKPGLVSIVISTLKGLPPELVERRRLGKPMFFPILELVDERYRPYGYNSFIEAKPVGDVRELHYITLHDMFYPALMADMTDHYFLEKDFDANAVSIISGSFEKVGEIVGKKSYQPLKISDDIYNLLKSYQDY